MTGTTLLEVALFSAMLVGVVIPYLTILIGIQARSDLRIVAPHVATLIDLSLSTIFRFLAPLTFLLVALGATEHVAGAAAVSLTLLLLFIPLLMFWTLATWQRRYDQKERQVVVIVALVSYYFLFILEISYGLWVLRLELGWILNIMVATVLGSAVTILLLAAWHYLQSPTAYARRIEKASELTGNRGLAKLIIERINERAHTERALSSTARKYLWKCPGKPLSDPREERVADEVQDFLGSPSHMRWRIGFLVLSLVQPLVRILTMIVHAFIDARYLNRALQNVAGERVWHWGEDLSDAEKLYAQLDVQAWKSRPLISHLGLHSLVWSWLIFDYLRHPDKTHRDRILEYNSEVENSMQELAGLTADREELYCRLVEEFGDYHDFSVYHQLQVQRVRKFRSILEERSVRRDRLLSILK